MAMYSECPNCGASLDAGEHCDCETQSEVKENSDLQK